MKLGQRFRLRLKKLSKGLQGTTVSPTVSADRLLPRSRRSLIANNHVFHVEAGAPAAFMVTYDPGRMPDFLSNVASGVSAGATGFAGHLKPGPTHMPPEFVDYLEHYAGRYVPRLSEDERERFRTALSQLRTPHAEARSSAISYLRSLAARQGASQLSLELAHWLAGDWFYGDPRAQPWIGSR
jgi:hypothetical protein